MVLYLTAFGSFGGKSKILIQGVKKCFQQNLVLISDFFENFLTGCSPLLIPSVVVYKLLKGDGGSYGFACYGEPRFASVTLAIANVMKTDTVVLFCDCNHLLHYSQNCVHFASA